MCPFIVLQCQGPNTRGTLPIVKPMASSWTIPSERGPRRSRHPTVVQAMRLMRIRSPDLASSLWLLQTGDIGRATDEQSDLQAVELKLPSIRGAAVALGRFNEPGAGGDRVRIFSAWPQFSPLGQAMCALPQSPLQPAEAPVTASGLLHSYLRSCAWLDEPS